MEYCFYVHDALEENSEYKCIKIWILLKAYVIILQWELILHIKLICAKIVITIFCMTYSFLVVWRLLLFDKNFGIALEHLIKEIHHQCVPAPLTMTYMLHIVLFMATSVTCTGTCKHGAMRSAMVYVHGDTCIYVCTTVKMWLCTLKCTLQDLHEGNNFIIDFLQICSIYTGVVNFDSVTIILPIHRMHTFTKCRLACLQSFSIGCIWFRDQHLLLWELW